MRSLAARMFLLHKQTDISDIHNFIEQMFKYAEISKQYSTNVIKEKETRV